MARLRLGGYSFLCIWLCKTCERTVNNEEESCKMAAPLVEISQNRSGVHSLVHQATPVAAC